MSDFFYSTLLIGGVSPSSSLNLWAMVSEAGLMVKFVMFLLLAISVLSWAIIFYKFYQIRKARRESYYFLESFWKNRNLSSVYTDSKNYQSSPVAAIFRIGYQELNRIRKSTRNGAADSDDADSSSGQFQGIELFQRTLRRTMNVEATRLARLLSFLATTGNTAPFIGLFGTVWGIMSSFHDIGQAGAANLAVVAPGISEALVATAAGLAAAIPAVVAFNYFSSRVRVLETEMTNFVADFLNILERDMMKRGAAQK